MLEYFYGVRTREISSTLFAIAFVILVHNSEDGTCLAKRVRLKWR